MQQPFEFLPQHGILTPLYLPTAKHIPVKAPFRVIGVQFLAVPALGTAYQNIQVKPAFNAWAIGAIDSLAGTFGFLMQVWHTSPGGQRQFFNTSLPSLTVAGTAANQQFLTETELFLNGDSIRIQVKNLDPVNADNIWVAIYGGDVVVPA